MSLTPAVVRRHVIFRSTAFNTTEVKPHFINDCCFGEDLARWLMEELRARGVATDIDPGQEDFGWFFTFTIGGTAHDCILGYRPGEGEADGDWMGTIERRAGLLASLFGARRRGIDARAPEALHAVLSASPRITAIRWFADADIGREQNAREVPVG